MYDLLIQGGILITPSRSILADLCIKNGKIAAVLAPGELCEATDTLDVTGKYVFPGFIDTHVHSRDGGATYKEDFLHSTRSAAAGGITTLLEMPNAVPAVATLENFYRQRENLASKAYVDFGMWALCVGDLNNDLLPSLEKEGVVGFKFFWGYAIRRDNFNLIYDPKIMDDSIIPPLTDGEVYRIFQSVAGTQRELAIHAENASLIRELTRTIHPSGYHNEYEALMASRPIAAEVTTCQTAISFAKATGARLHILHVTSRESADLIRKARESGLPVSGETCPHYLFLTNKDYDRLGNMMKCYPPIRFQEDQDALWAALRDGTLNHVCSDHAPHTAEEKQGVLAEVPAGMCGIESMIPLMLTAVNQGKLTLNQLSAVLSENPAKQYGLYPQKGSLDVGTDADITIVDMNQTGTVKSEELHSVSKVTPFDGFQLHGIPVATILRGKLIMWNGELIDDCICGRFIKAFSD